ncbi:hypothetical protein M011DRAFT_467071 [Sporormia fimetaria CBS 119925]|uniref:Uncharacterized protein n=1 Tax=Sporormia fimetaria CBS 119925 TaxID=1340428 RepID=A0A6A6VCZ2_9PLEO|nr:hypothetical protein M011DRAFT_467071 [Sporormia fimetaria CBS 119925]
MKLTNLLIIALTGFAAAAPSVIKTGINNDNSVTCKGQEPSIGNSHANAPDIDNDNAGNLEARKPRPVDTCRLCDGHFKKCVKDCGWY